MILTDFSAVSIASIINSATRERISLDENVIKHIVFTTFKNIHKILGGEFGQHLLLCDSRSWRKDEFEYYKANRVKDSSGAIDWDLIHRMMDEIREAFDKHFPFHVIKEKNCEADDLIAAFVKKANEPVVIVSKDKDFYQLHRAGVQQWDYSKKKFIVIDNPDEFRLEHIIRGDSGDGVPNIMSDDDTFVNADKRQKKMTSKRLKEFNELAKVDFVGAPVELKRNWSRNKMLIDLTTPKDFALSAVDKYNTADRKIVTQNDTSNYLASHKMIVLFSKVSEFFKGKDTQSKEDIGPLSQFM